MNGMSFGLFAVSFLFFLGTAHNLLAFKRPGMYPPKQRLKKRAEAFAKGGAVFFIVGLIFVFLR